MTIDGQGYERRKRRCGSIVCKCGHLVVLYQAELLLTEAGIGYREVDHAAP